jgi:hypothetical protein
METETRVGSPRRWLLVLVAGVSVLVFVYGVGRDDPYLFGFLSGLGIGGLFWAYDQWPVRGVGAGDDVAARQHQDGGKR